MTDVAEGKYDVYGRAFLDPNDQEGIAERAARAHDVGAYLYMELRRSEDGSTPGNTCDPQPGPLDNGLYGIYDGLAEYGYWWAETHFIEKCGIIGADAYARAYLAVALAKGETRHWPVKGQHSEPKGLALSVELALDIAMTTEIERQWYMCVDGVKWPVTGYSDRIPVYGPDQPSKTARRWTILRPARASVQYLKEIGFTAP